MPLEEQTKDPLPARRSAGFVAVGAAAEPAGADVSLAGQSQCPPRAPPTNPITRTPTATTGRTHLRRVPPSEYWVTPWFSSASGTVGNGWSRKPCG